jgi:hypothetical protein
VEPNLPLKKVEQNLPLKKVKPNLLFKKVEQKFGSTFFKGGIRVYI